MSFVATPMFPGLLSDAAADFAAGEKPDSGSLAPTWQAARALGWDGLLVPEALGGSGGSLHDLASLVEALGTRGFVLPVAARCGAAPLLLLGAAQDDDAARELLRGLAAQTVELAWLRPAARSPHLTCESLPATHLLATAPGGTRLVAFEASRLPAPDARWRAVDGTPIDAFLPDTLPWSAATPLQPAGAVGEAATLLGLMGCVEQVAAMGALIAHTTTHLDQRSQFGVVLSSFQVLRHQIVDMYVKYESARGFVADCVARGALDLRTVETDVRLAQLYVGESGRFVAERAVQLHGAIGMSEELPVARLCKRLLATEFGPGDGLSHSLALTRDLRQRVLAAA